MEGAEISDLLKGDTEIKSMKMMTSTIIDHREESTSIPDIGSMIGMRSQDMVILKELLGLLSGDIQGRITCQTEHHQETKGGKQPFQTAVQCW